MAVFPFELVIKSTSPGNRSEVLLCKKCLREIPGRRVVYDAVWGDRAVVVKLFSRRIGASRRLRKERAGLERLKSCGVDTPELLFCGETSDGRLAVVTEKIVDSPTALDVFLKTPAGAERADLLLRICREMASQHIHGVVQRDLHLDNFLLDGEKMLMLDPGQMEFFEDAVPRSRSISQLALLARHLPADDSESISRLCCEYFAAREWTFGEADRAIFDEQVMVHTKRIMRRTLRKSLRTNKRQLRLRTNDWAGMFERGFCGKDEPAEMAERVDELMASGEILKNGNTCYISRFIWNGTDVVVKCYKHKGLIHSLRHTLKRSRARQSWLQAHRLGVLEVLTPRPLAYFERLKGPVVWKSYFVTEYVNGEKLYYYLRNDNISPEQRSAAIERTLEVLEKLAGYGITHGDVKPSNILITPEGPYLTDLDSMHVHRLNLACRIRSAKDTDLIKGLGKDFGAAGDRADEKPQ